MLLTSKFNDISIIVIAAINGALFIFYLLLFFLYIKQYKHQDIISFTSAQLVLSSAILSFFYIYYYFKSYFDVLCVINYIYQPSATMTTILLSGCIPFITMKILTYQEKIGEKFKKYAILSILLCWLLPLIIVFIMYFIDKHLKPDDPEKKCTFSSEPIKIVTYCSYFVICVVLEFLYWKLELELRALMKEAEKKTRGKHKEKCILQFKRFHIMNVANLVWQLFTVLIAFNVFRIDSSKPILGTLRNVIRLVVTIFFFGLVWILCMTKDRMSDLGKFLLCSLEQVKERDTIEEMFDDDDYETELKI